MGTSDSAFEAVGGDPIETNCGFGGGPATGFDPFNPMFGPEWGGGSSTAAGSLPTGFLDPTDPMNEPMTAF